MVIPKQHNWAKSNELEQIVDQRISLQRILHESARRRVWTGDSQSLNCFLICLHSCLCKYLSCLHRDCHGWRCDPAFLAAPLQIIRWTADQSTLARVNGTCATPEQFPHLFTELFVQIFVVCASWLLVMQPRISSCTVAKTYSEMHIRIHWLVRTGHAQPLNSFPIWLHRCSCKYLSCVADQSTLVRANRTCTALDLFPHLFAQLFVQIFIVCTSWLLVMLSRVSSCAVANHTLNCRSEYIGACELDMRKPWTVSPSVYTVVCANICRMYIVIVGYVIPCF